MSPTSNTIHYLEHQWLAGLVLVVMFRVISIFTEAVIKIGQKEKPTHEGAMKIAVFVDGTATVVWLFSLLYFVYCCIILIYLWSIE